MRETCLQAGKPKFADKGENKRPAADAAQMVERRGAPRDGRSLRRDNAVDTCCCSNMGVGGTSEKNEVSGNAIQEGCTNWTGGSFGGQGGSTCP